MAIPHIIHYCWLSDSQLSPFASYCLSQWKKLLPDWEFCLWDKKAFDITQVAWVNEAYALKKYAFAADYVRLYALYHHGGLYLDLDVVLKGDPSQFFTGGFVSFVECYYDEHGRLYSGCDIQAAVMAAERGNAYVKEALDFYVDRHFTLDAVSDKELIAPRVLMKLAKAHGYREVDEEQHLEEGIVIYPSKFCSPNSKGETPQTVAVHFSDHSWQDRGWASNIAKKVRGAMRALRMKMGRRKAAMV